MGTRECAYYNTIKVSMGLQKRQNEGNH